MRRPHRVHCSGCGATFEGSAPEKCPRCESRAFHRGQHPRAQSVAALMDRQPLEPERPPVDVTPGPPARHRRRGRGPVYGG